MTAAVRTRLAAALLAAGAIGGAVMAGATAASETSVTIGLRPSIVRFVEKPEIYGETTGKADEEVTVQFRQCGLYPEQYRAFMTTRTNERGGWNLDELLYVGLSIPASGTFRALWNGEVSREVSLKMRAGVNLQRLRRGLWEVWAFGTQSFWRNQVRLERFDARSRRWVLVRTLLLTETGGSRYYGGSSAITMTKPFRPAVPKGTTLRAVLPLQAARPCYIGGYSRVQRT